MPIPRQTLVAALSLACLALPLTSACGPDTMGPDDELQAGGFELSELTENIEAPADETIDPLGQTCQGWGAAALCLDGESAAFCGVYNPDAALEFGACIPVAEVECIPGDIELVELACGEVEANCMVWDGVPGWTNPVCEQESGDTPLVLRFDDAPITMIDASATPAATFDIAMAADASSCITTDWPTASSPWLAIDLDHSGTIDGGHELFGSGTDLADGKAKNGFLALAAYDDNHDGKLDTLDARFSDLVLWRDHDADRLSSPGELESLSDAGVDSLTVSYGVDRRCDARGNCGVERSVFSHAGGSGEIVDLHLACQ